LRQFAG
jgi:integrase/recombinase XerD